MQRGGAGRVSTASPGAHSARRRRPARPEPWGQRAEEQVLEAEPRQRRAAAAQVRPGPGGGPGQPGEERSRRRQRRRRRRGLGVSREGRAEQRVPVTPPRGAAGAPQSPAPGAAGAGRRTGRGQRGRAFLETRGTPESRGEKRHFLLASSPEGAQQRAASRRTPGEAPVPGRERARRTQGSSAGLKGSLRGSRPSAARGAASGSRREGRERSSGPGDPSPRYTPTPPAAPEPRCASGGARSPAPSLPGPSTAGLPAGLAGPLGMPKSGMVAEWLLSPDQRKSWG